MRLQSVDDCLVRHRRQIVADAQVRVRPHLRQHDADQLLGRVHPEDGAERAAPVVGAFRAGRRRRAQVGHDGVAQAEAVTRAGEADAGARGVVGAPTCIMFLILP